MDVFVYYLVLFSTVIVFQNLKFEMGEIVGLGALSKSRSLRRHWAKAKETICFSLLDRTSVHGWYFASASASRKGSDCCRFATTFRRTDDVTIIRRDSISLNVVSKSLSSSSPSKSLFYSCPSKSPSSGSLRCFSSAAKREIVANPLVKDGTIEGNYY